MLGYNTLREIPVWVQTDGPAEVQLRYYPVDSAAYVMHSAAVATTEGGSDAVKT